MNPITTAPIESASPYQVKLIETAIESEFAEFASDNLADY